MTSPQTPAGWYPDPEGSGQQRYWDGQQWTQHYAGAGGGPPQAPAGGPPQTPGPGGYAPARAVGPAPPLWWGVPIAVLLAIIGSIGKWVTVEATIFGQSASDSASGLDGDGWFTVICPLIAFALLLLWRAQRQRWQAIVAAVFGAIATLVALYHIADPAAGEETLGGALEAKAGWGVWLAFLASLALTALAVVLAIQSGNKGRATAA